MFLKKCTGYISQITRTGDLKNCTVLVNPVRMVTLIKTHELASRMERVKTIRPANHNTVGPASRGRRDTAGRKLTWQHRQISLASFSFVYHPSILRHSININVIILKNYIYKGI